MSSISQSKGNQTMKFGQVTEYKKTIRNINLKSFFKSLCEVKASDLQLSFNIFQWSATWLTIKTNCLKL